MARDASRPVAIASETLATAATSIENTSGPTVMRSALSQSVPIASMLLAAECANSLPECSIHAPRQIPSASAPRTIQCRS
jgi:hypothetical protein